MSRENVEVVRRAVDAFNRRDLAAFLAFMDPEVEFVSAAGIIEGGSGHGYDGIRQSWADLFSVYPDWRMEIVEARDLGDRVVATVRAGGHGADSGTPIDATMWITSGLRRARVVWWRTCRHEAEALEAMGLRE